MALELRQTIKLSQQLVMTPQLQQAIKMLQLSRMELADTIREELEKNPLLEEALEEGGPTGSEAEVDGADGWDKADSSANNNSEGDSDGNDFSADSDGMSTSSGDAAPDAEVPTTSNDEKEVTGEDFDITSQIEWENYLDAYDFGTSSMSGGYEDKPTADEFVGGTESLSEHLHWQLQMDDYDGRVLQLAEFIVGNLDDRGYLETSLEDLAAEFDASEEDLAEALDIVQSLDPAGVGARNLVECLILQAKNFGFDENHTVYRILGMCCDLIESRDYKAIAKRLSITIEDVIEAMKVIAGFEPNPGRAYGANEARYIIPDVFVRKVGDRYEVLINDDGLPRLKVSPIYHSIAKRKNGALSKEDKDYIQERARSANWLIKSIHQRQQTVHKVAAAIVEKQIDFFEKGVAHLTPMVLRDIAEEVEIHESTVSRVTTNKYMHTPRGIFELKYFFNSGVNRSDGGDAIASEAVKDRIKKLIDGENPKKPYSDQALVNLLQEEGIEIARRTVTKYREALHLGSSKDRRRAF